LVNGIRITDRVAGTARANDHWETGSRPSYATFENESIPSYVHIRMGGSCTSYTLLHIRM
jgi:hypothetical protein